MPFRCKCGRTFEKLDTFGSHTSGCAPFHHRRISTSEVLTTMNDQKTEEKRDLNKKRLSLQTDPNTLSYFNQRFLLLSPTSPNTKSNDSFFPQFQKDKPSTPCTTPIYEGYGGFMMPTALSIQNTFEGVRKRRSMSYSSANPSSSFM